MRIRGLGYFVVVVLVSNLVSGVLGFFVNFCYVFGVFCKHMAV